jgi:hypothetical protein
LQVVWIIEGDVLNHTVHSIDIEFDMRSIPAGAKLTRVLTVQVTDQNGQGCIVHSSVFIQIFVMQDDLRKSDSVLNPMSPYPRIAQRDCCRAQSDLKSESCSKPDAQPARDGRNRRTERKQGGREQGLRNSQEKRL